MLLPLDFFLPRYPLKGWQQKGKTPWKGLFAQRNNNLLSRSVGEKQNQPNMQTKKFLTVPAIALSLFGLSATNPSAPEKALTEECKQCGVTNTQVSDYLRNCSHHHTVFYVQDIPGSCNSSAGIENCGTATVFVSGGAIIGHADNGIGGCQ
jgi:hypothetical protein